MARIELSDKPQRAWVNAPSTLQTYHAYHGMNVIAVHEWGDVWRAYPTSGDVISFQVCYGALSAGWRSAS